MKWGMMLRIIFYCLLFTLIGIALHASVGNSLLVVAPDILLILVVRLAMYSKSVSAMILAFIVGIIADFATGVFIGPYAASYLLAYSLTAFISQKIYAEQIFSICILLLIASVLKAITYVAMVGMYTEFNILTLEFIYTSLYEIVFTIILAPLIVPLISVAFRSSVKS